MKKETYQKHKAGVNQSNRQNAFDICKWLNNNYSDVTDIYKRRK